LRGEFRKYFSVKIPGRYFDRSEAAERFPQRMTPLGWSAISDLIPENFKALEDSLGVVFKTPQDLVIDFNGWIYSNPRAFRFPAEISLRWRRFFGRHMFRRLLRALGEIFLFAGRGTAWIK